MNNVTLHPKTLIAEAAIIAYERGLHLKGGLGEITLAAGRDAKQYATALKVRTLEQLACEIKNA